MYFLSQEFHSVKEENENLRKENRSNVPLYTYERTFNTMSTYVERIKGKIPKKWNFFMTLAFWQIFVFKCAAPGR